jgi:rSAM/selenodomain-associated transferase 1
LQAVCRPASAQSCPVGEAAANLSEFRHPLGATLPGMRRACVIVGKAPEPGQTKTRLVPPLTAEEAAELYRGFLLDAVHLGLSLDWERVSVVHPQGSRQALADLLPPEVCLVEQRGHGLFGALSYAFERHLAEGFREVVLIGSDNPTVPAGPVHEACAALADHDLTIGPSADGGYYLLGMRASHPGVLEHIDWSTARVYAQTLAQARRLSLRVHAVAEWYDVDEPADLERLQRDLSGQRLEVAAHTRAVLTRLTSGVS